MNINLMKTFEIDYKFDEPFTLECGKTLPSLQLRCTIYGELNADKSNAILVFHALTGSSKIADWWSDIIGDGKSLDTSQFAFICVNYIGSCYGSTGADFFAFLGKNNKKEFAPATVRDIVRSQVYLLEYLGIKKFQAVIGGSVGGMCALQFAVDFPKLTDQIIAIGATPLSAFGLALNHIQRKALDIENDVQIARQIATLSYKSSEIFNERFGRQPNRNGENPRENFTARFDVAGYLDYQGEIFTERFCADSYRLITKAMDLFDLTDEEIKRIKAKITLVGISSDWLFPARDVESLAERFEANGTKTDYIEFVSLDGHDAFLSDTARMSEILRRTLKENSEFRFRNSIFQKNYERKNCEQKTTELFTGRKNRDCNGRKSRHRTRYRSSFGGSGRERRRQLFEPRNSS